MAYVKSRFTFSGSNSLNDMRNNYHIDLYVNDHLITSESDATLYLHDGGSTNNPDKIEKRTQSGYAFSGDVYGSYKNAEGTTLRPQMTKTGDTIAIAYIPQGTAQNTIYPAYKGSFISGGVSIPYNTVVETGTSYQLTKNLTNASVTPNISTVTAGISYTLEINADSGYYFDDETPPELYYIDNEDLPHYLTVSKISDTQYRAIFTADETDYILDASAIALPAQTPINVNGLSHCHISPNILAVTVGVTTQIDVIADNGYYFEDNTPPVLYIPYDNEGGQTTVNGTKIDETTYRFSVTTDEYDIALNFIGTADEIPATTPLTKNLTNCSLSPNISALVFNQVYTLILTANNGYRFDVAPSLRYRNSEGTIIYYESVKISNYEYRFNNVCYDDTDDTYFTLTATANAESQTSEKYGVLAIHKITADNLKAINDLRYYSGGSSLSQIDLSQYFASLKVIYCDVATATSDAIIVSDINTNVIAPKVTDDYTILNLGNVSLAGEYQNALDKKYSEITINLPFVSAYKLDSAFMNETINIKYRVHLISGDVTVIISLVRNDTEYLIDTISGNMSFDLPFTYTINGETKPINANVNNPINFNVAPSVTIRQRLKADVYNSVYQCYKIDTPANENGYFKIERLDADTIPASASIRNKIENLLKAGVYN